MSAATSPLSRPIPTRERRPPERAALRTQLVTYVAKSVAALSNIPSAVKLTYADFARCTGRDSDTANAGTNADIARKLGVSVRTLQRRNSTMRSAGLSRNILRGPYPAERQFLKHASLQFPAEENGQPLQPFSIADCQAQGGAWKIRPEVRNDPNLPHGAKLLDGIIDAHAGKSGIATLSQATMAQLLGQRTEERKERAKQAGRSEDYTTIRHYIKLLVKAGYKTVVKVPGKRWMRNTYRITSPKGVTSFDDVEATLSDKGVTPFDDVGVTSFDDKEKLLKNTNSSSTFVVVAGCLSEESIHPVQSENDGSIDLSNINTPEQKQNAAAPPNPPQKQAAKRQSDAGTSERSLTSPESSNRAYSFRCSSKAAPTRRWEPEAEHAAEVHKWLLTIAEKFPSSPLKKLLTHEVVRRACEIGWKEGRNGYQVSAALKNIEARTKNAPDSWSYVFKSLLDFDWHEWQWKEETAQAEEQSRRNRKEAERLEHEEYLRWEAEELLPETIAKREQERKESEAHWAAVEAKNEAQRIAKCEEREAKRKAQMKGLEQFREELFRSRLPNIVADFRERGPAYECIATELDDIAAIVDFDFHKTSLLLEKLHEQMLDIATVDADDGPTRRAESPPQYPRMTPDQFFDLEKQDWREQVRQREKLPTLRRLL